jgi:hypothetical protein
VPAIIEVAQSRRRDREKPDSHRIVADSGVAINPKVITLWSEGKLFGCRPSRGLWWMPSRTYLVNPAIFLAAINVSGYSYRNVYGILIRL